MGEGVEAGAVCSVAGACGAAVWASAEPERATPAVNREAIANLRIMMSEPRTIDIADPAGTRQLGWRDLTTIAACDRTRAE
jgi:hypothetical protein